MPFFEEFKAGGEAGDDFFTGATEGRAVGILWWQQVMDGEELSAGGEPARRRRHVVIPPVRRDGAIKSVFEKPGERRWGRVVKKIRFGEGSGQTRGCRAASRYDRAGREIKTRG